MRKSNGTFEDAIVHHGWIAEDFYLEDLSDDPVMKEYLRRRDVAKSSPYFVEGMVEA